jgi:hypothetical protein
MSKPTLVYGAVLVLSVGGLWGILRAGSHLSAVADLTGEWTIEDGPQGPSGLQMLGGAFTVEQSGRFLRVKFKGGQSLDLRAADPPMGPIAGKVTVRADGGGSRLDGTLWPDEDAALHGSFTLAGPTAARFLAVRATPKGAAKPGH